MINWMSLKRSARLSLLLLLFLLPYSPAHGKETIILNIIVNEVKKGEFFVIMTETGDFFIKTEDLKQIGFRDPGGTVYEIDNELYTALNSIEEVEYTLDEKDLSLKITAAPFHFEKTAIDLKPPRQSNVFFTRDTSAFLNYSLNYGIDSSDQHQADVVNQLGIRYMDFSFLSDSVYTNNQDTDQFVRLMSSITYDRRNDFQRVIIGDFFASSGNLGSTFNLGGFSYQKIFLMDPYFIQHPAMNLTGSVMLPSTMDIYLDGTLIGQKDLPPGEFDFRNVTNRSGAGLVELVLTDPFGKEERLAYPFYLDNRFLEKGLQEYSYNIGFLREGFGKESFKYGDLVLSGFHRYGVNNNIVVDVQGELSENIYTFGPSASYLIPSVGVITMSFAESHNDDDQWGSLITLGYRYQSRGISTQLDARSFTKHYTTLSIVEPEKRKKNEYTARVGYNIQYVGSVNVIYSRTTHYEGKDRQVLTAGYSKHLFKDISFFARYQWIQEIEETSEITVLLHYSPGQQMSLTTTYQQSEDTKAESIQVRKNPTLGKGISGRALIQREDSVHTFDGLLQYDSRFGTYTGRYRSFDGDSTSEVSASGAIAYVGKTVGLTRPVRDSFGLVEVADVKDVRVYQNSQEIGRTNSKGKVFLPDLGSFFNNQISIKDQDIPIDYTIPEVVKFISPPLRSGSYIKFEASKFQAAVGTIGVRVDGKVQPVEYYEMKLILDGQEITFPTGREGEFYIENIHPGTFTAFFNFMEKSCSFDIIIPAVEDVIIDLGELICEPNA
jgi:outer membrane usher protein